MAAPQQRAPHDLGITELSPANVGSEALGIILECQVEAKQLILENRDKLDSIVDTLIEYETINEESAYAAAGI